MLSSYGSYDGCVCVCVVWGLQVEDGVVKKLNVETGGPFGVSSADTMLEQLAAVKA